jgi:hypothetical protein
MVSVITIFYILIILIANFLIKLIKGDLKKETTQSIHFTNKLFISSDSMLLETDDSLSRLPISADISIYVSGKIEDYEKGIENFHVLIAEKDGTESSLVVDLDYADAKMFFNYLSAWSQEMPVYVKQYGLPEYGRGDITSRMMSHIYYLINYRDAKFELQ